MVAPDENYVALYKQGDSRPAGAIRESIVEPLLADLQGHTPHKYSTEPITHKQAERIVTNITRGSKKLETLLSRETE